MGLKSPWSPRASKGVSVIIPTRDRPADLVATIRSLMQQTVRPTQLIVIDQSESSQSQQCTHTALAEAEDSKNRTVRLAYIRDPSISGGAVARNRAMEIADEDVWLFLDDDVVLETDFIEHLLETYAQGPDIAGVSGVITNYLPPTFWVRAWSRLFCAGIFWDERQPLYWKANRTRGGVPVRVTKFGAGLMSFRADIIRLHRFDENLCGVSDGEDVDFCSRLPKGSVLVITPKARLVHKHSPVGRSREHWLARHVRTMWYLYRRNWNHGVINRLCLIRLNLGYCVIAICLAIRRGSSKPFHDISKAIEDSAKLLLPPAAGAPLDGSQRNRTRTVGY